jgi:putative ABC transport system permease protein
MLRNYVFSAVRAIRRHVGTTALNVLALGAGLAVALFVLLFIADQKRLDRFHAAGDQTYRVLAERSDSPQPFGATPAPLASVLSTEVPAVEQVTRIRRSSLNPIVDGQAVTLEGIYAEPSFLDVFDFRLDAGTPTDALDAPGQIVLSHEAAQRLFGTADGVVGRTVTLDGRDDMTVSGLLDRSRYKTHLRFEALVSWSTQGAGNEALTDWGNLWTFATYVRLADGADPEAAVTTLNAVTPAADEAREDVRVNFQLQPITSIALGPNIANQVATTTPPGFLMYVLLALAGVVLLTVGFNYTGLAVAQALRRSAEVGVRKALGARRREVVAQFLVESLLLAGLALGLALVLLPLLTGAFNQTLVAQRLGAGLYFDATNVLLTLGIGVGVTLVAGLVAGFYPAVFLSGFRPVTAMSGPQTSTSASGRLRTAIMFGQVTLAVVVSVTAVLLYSQFQYMAEAQFGFDSEHVLAIEAQDVSYETLHDGMQNHSGVVSVGGIRPIPATGRLYFWQVERPAQTTGGEEAEPLSVVSHGVTPRTTDVLGLDLLAGRPLTDADMQAARDTAQTSTSVLVTELMVKAMGYASPEDAIGQRFRTTRSETHTIAGVVSDFRSVLPSQPLEPVVLYPSVEQIDHMLVRVRTGAEAAVRSHAEVEWETTGSPYVLESEMLDAKLARSPMTATMGDASYIVMGIAGFAVLLACLGLLGMAAYRAETRVREVGIRKALGASVGHVVWLLSTHTVRLVGVALMVALPAAWYLNRMWLDTYAYRIDPGVALFAVCALGVVLLAAGAVAVPTLRAARTDPAKVLRSE